MNIATVTLAPVEEVWAAEARQAASERQQVSARKAGRAYAERIDSLLRNSAETRGDLGALIENIRTGELTAAQSHGQIIAIANQRQDLQNAVSAVPVGRLRARPGRLRARPGRRRRRRGR